MECPGYGHDRQQSHCVQFLDVIQNYLKNVGDVIQHGAKVVHIVPPCDKDVMLSNYIMYAPCIPSTSQDCLPMVIDWTSSTGLLPCQTQPGSAHEPWFPLSRQKLQEQHQGQGCLRILPY